MEEKNKKKDKKRRIINWTLNILLVILLIVGIYLLATRILGHSPTDFQLILWMVGFFGTAMLKIFSLIYSINRAMGEFKINIKNSCEKIKKDIKDIKTIVSK
jgi:O-antigen/teichoic acid export membrane protein